MWGLRDPRLSDPASTGDDEDRAIAIAYLRDMEALHWDTDEYLTFAYRALNLLPPRDWTARPSIPTSC